MRILSLASILSLFALIIACGDSKEAPGDSSLLDSAETKLQQKALGIFKQMPAPEPFGSSITTLGKELYYETALSINNELSCNSCHMLDQYGVDNLATSPGHEGKTGDRNSPSVYNAYMHIAQFWDGRAMDLTEQAKGPILNPIEMGMGSDKEAVERLLKKEGYKEKFKEAFPDAENPVTYQNLAESIAAFEKTLGTPSRFDKYLAGDMTAITEDEKKGLEVFMENGCTACHMGPGIGGQMYQKFGLVKGPYWEYTGSELHDRGRAEITQNEAEEFFFKVPSLRNVTETAPYFHDGSVSDLGGAIRIMAITQLGKDLSEEEITAILAFLRSLKGEIPEHALLEEDVTAK